jgi:hypothetical protein
MFEDDNIMDSAPVPITTTLPVILSNSTVNWTVVIAIECNVM